ncbi:hypothetical protein Btru_060305 [Bulinus truncatus]|nr:hypothetical protein Btru_060305 [Bulinus truncatus]
MGMTTVNGTVDNFAIIMTPLDIAYVTVTFLMSLMSILGSVVVLFVHWSYAELRTSGRTMLVHLTVADLLTALGNLLGIVWKWIQIAHQSKWLTIDLQGVPLRLALSLFYDVVLGPKPLFLLLIQ